MLGKYNNNGNGNGSTERKTINYNTQSYPFERYSVEFSFYIIHIV